MNRQVLEMLTEGTFLLQILLLRIQSLLFDCLLA